MIVLITGSRKGIGRFLAESLLKQKNTVIGCSRSESDLKHDNYVHYIVDVSDEKAVKEMVGKIRKTYGYIDALINNAGIAAMNHFLLTPTEVANRIMNTNYIGTFIVTRECSRLLKKSDNPRVVNFTSVAKPLKLEGEAIYAASKAAVETLTEVLSKELAPYNITVNAVGPTPIDTSLTANVPKDKLKNLVNSQAIKRFGEFEDVLNVVEFFIRPESNFITGQIIYLGGIS